MNGKTKKEELCIRCQKCCREVSVYTHPILYSCSAEKVVKFYEARGFEVEHLQEDAIVMTLKLPCPHLSPSGCDIYDSRPAVCREYSGIADFGDGCLWSTLEK